jgi:DNA-binding YbaB/EbfC family protein
MFRGGNINQLMKMAKQLQQQALKLKEEIENREFVGTAGGGAVKVVAKGSGEIVTVEISSELLNPEEKEMLKLVTFLHDAGKAGEQDDGQGLQGDSHSSGLFVGSSTLEAMPRGVNPRRRG